VRAVPRFPLSEQTAPAEGQPLETLALLALAALFVLAVLLWAAGELAGRLFGGAWPHVSASAMGGLLVRLARTPGDPARAWPPTARQLLPGPLPFYSVLALLLALPLSALTGALVRRERRRAGAAIASRWARRHDLRALSVRHAQPGRLTLGRAH